MLQNQRLDTILNVLEQNKTKELSYLNKVNFLCEEKMNFNCYSIIRDRYTGFDSLEGIKLYNSLEKGFFKHNSFNIQN